MNDIFDELRWRGLVHQTTDDAQPAGVAQRRQPHALLPASIRRPTACTSGSLLPLLMLRRFQRAGHRPIALVGGATGMIGDPSGKSEERNLLSVDVLRANVAGIEAQMRRFLDFDAGTERRAMLVNNFDWMSRFSYLDFLRDVGKNFPVNVMLAKDSVKSRLERDDAGISYTEFSYMLLQAYDFVYLHDKSRLRAANRRQRPMGQHHGRHRPGPADARRAALRPDLPAAHQERRHARWARPRAAPSGCRPARTSPYQFYQYWINVDDADAGKCLRFLTELPREEIESLDAARAADPGKRESQRRLAEELTRLVHGEAGLASGPAGDRDLLRRRDQRAVRRAARRNLRRCAEPRAAARRDWRATGSTSSTRWSKPAWPRAKATPGARSSKAGAYVNNRRIEGLDAQLDRARPGQRIGDGAAQRQEEVRAAAIRRSISLCRESR